MHWLACNVEAFMVRVHWPGAWTQFLRPIKEEDMDPDRDHDLVY